MAAALRKFNEQNPALRLPSSDTMWDSGRPELGKAPGRKRRKFSAECDAHEGSPQQRWAKVRGEWSESATAKAAKPRRKLSRAGTAAIVAGAQKALGKDKGGAANA